jgi:hypothetical protein
MSRVVQTPDGQRLYGVPNSVSDEEAIQNYLSAKNNGVTDFSLPEPEPVVEEPKPVVEEQEEETEAPVVSQSEALLKTAVEEDPSTAADIVRGLTQYGRFVPKVITDVLPTPPKFESSDQFIDQTTKAFAQMVTDIIPGVESEDVVTEEGKVKERGLAGASVQVAPYIVGGSIIQGSKYAAKTPSLIRAAVEGTLLSQLFYTGDEEETFFNLLENDDITNESAKALIEFMSIDKDDTVLEERVKLLAENAVVGGGGMALLKIIERTAPAVVETVRKPLSSLTKKEQVRAIVDGLKINRNKAPSAYDPAKVTEYIKIDEDAAQVFLQNKFRPDMPYTFHSGPLRRFMQRTFTSRGYWTPKAFNAFNDAAYAQRQIVAQAEHISNRLKKSLDDLNSDVKTRTAATNVQRALSENLDFPPDMSVEKQISRISQKYKINKNIATEVVNARNLIDDLSGKIVNSDLVSPDFKEAIVDNMGMYIRRSYRMYEDAGYRPSSAAVKEATEYFRQQARNQGKTELEEIEEFASNKVQEVLKSISNIDDNKKFESYYDKVSRLNKSILQKREEIPQAIRNLMGEIKNPSENIILTVSKLSRLTENNRFYNELYQLGKGKYIFDESKSNVGADVVISGTNSFLDGKFTTKEQVTAIQNKVARLSALDNSFFTGLANIKGMSQKQKTVYSLTTHARNITGGAQFGAFNGINPFAYGNTTRQVLWNRINRGGDAELDAMYEKYLRLGIINTSVRANETRELLKIGAEADADTFITRLGQKAVGYGVPKKLVGVTEAVDDALTSTYMAVDDFYKINVFETELATFKRAYPNESIDVLEEESAWLARNMLPNYDLVPPTIKQLRYLPVGNFVSFPAEIMRTSANMLKQSAKEIGSGNDVIRRRGLQRLAGISTGAFGFTLGATATYQLAGFDSEEQKAIERLAATPWSKAPKNVIRIDDKLYVNDTQYIDSYSAVKEPFAEIARQIKEGELKGEQLDERLGDAIYQGITNILAPYFGESMVTEAVLDVQNAIRGSGYTKDGKEISVEGMSFLDTAAAAMYHIFESFAPGTYSSFKNVVDAANDKQHPVTGKIKDPFIEAAGSLTGFKLTEFDARDSFKYKVKAYARKKRNMLLTSPSFGQLSTDMVDRYVSRQEALYNLQQELYMDYLAADTLIGGTAIQIMLDNLGDEEAQMIIAGVFRQDDQLTDKKLTGVLEKMNMDSEKHTDYVNRIIEAQTRMYSTPLMNPDPDQVDEIFSRDTVKLLDTSMEGVEDLPTEEEEKERLPYAKGGEVIVPNAPVEPDERIDKMTGLPYNIQAGSAFVDEEDPEKRMLFNLGGIVSKALGISEDDIAWAKSMSKKYPEAEELDGRGDAARHLALGWLAKQSNYPSFSKFAANAREFVEFDFKGGSMDIENNNKGFNMKAATREEAEEEIQKMIRNKEVLYYTPTESKSRRGYQVGGSVEDPSMYRSDGSKKSAQGFLGPVKNNVEGGTMTEVSVGMEINGQEMEVPTMVPSLTKEEIETLANMQLEGNAKNIPESIIIKAKQHALQRIDQGLSPFYQDGEK